MDKKEEVVPVPAPGLTRTRERDLLRPVKRVKPRLNSFINTTSASKIESRSPPPNVAFSPAANNAYHQRQKSQEALVKGKMAAKQSQTLDPKPLKKVIKHSKTPNVLETVDKVVQSGAETLKHPRDEGSPFSS